MAYKDPNYRKKWYYANLERERARARIDNARRRSKKRKEINAQARIVQNKRYSSDPAFRKYKIEHATRYYVSNRKEIAKRRYKVKEELRLSVLNAYGGKCTCCGERGHYFLAMDHIAGGGGKHYKEIGGAQQFYKWLKKNNFPKGFQVLCWNCNWGKRRCGICPHQQPHS